MNLNFKPQLNSDDIEKSLKAAIAIIETKIVEKFKQVGMEFVRNARLKGAYTDRTGNLRSSIGYIVYKDGQPLKSAADFVEADKGTDKATGVKTGRALAESVPVPQQGYALVVVAGMNYAKYVEAKNYEVIRGSSLQAEKDLKAALASI